VSKGRVRVRFGLVVQAEVDDNVGKEYNLKDAHGNPLRITSCNVVSKGSVHHVHVTGHNLAHRDEHIPALVRQPLVVDYQHV